jgi:hypothetical protein
VGAHSFHADLDARASQCAHDRCQLRPAVGFGDGGAASSELMLVEAVGPAPTTTP